MLYNRTKEGIVIRHLAKLAVASKVLGDAERRTAVYTLVHEDSSTASTTQFAAAVGFGKMSISGFTGHFTSTQRIFFRCVCTWVVFLPMFFLIGLYLGS